MERKEFREYLKENLNTKVEGSAYYYGYLFGEMLNGCAAYGEEDLFEKFTAKMEEAVEMPESLKTVIQSDNTREAVYDLMEFGKFWQFMAENWDKDLEGKPIQEWLEEAIRESMWIGERKTFFNYINKEMGWESEKQRKIRELEAELEELRNS
jgi:hypothetical protein